MEAYFFQKGMFFMLQFKKHLVMYGIEHSASRDQTELMFPWKGVDIRLTLSPKGNIIAGERYNMQGGRYGYNISSPKAVMLTVTIRAYRLRSNS